MENYRKGNSLCDRNTYTEIFDISVSIYISIWYRDICLYLYRKFLQGWWELLVGMVSGSWGPESPPWLGCSLLLKAVLHAVLTLKAQPSCKEAASQGAWLKGQLWLQISGGDSVPPPTALHSSQCLQAAPAPPPATAGSRLHLPCALHHLFLLLCLIWDNLIFVLCLALRIHLGRHRAPQVCFST